jgi:FkbM family methyltransferase
MYLKFITLLRLIYYFRAYAFVIIFKSWTSKSSFQFDLNGVPFFIRKGTSDFFVFTSIFAFNEFKLSGVDKKIKTIVDLGANNGASARFFSQKFPEATIYALEPDTDNFEILRKNVQGIRNIKPLNLAIWGKDGIVSLVSSKADAWAKRFGESPAGIRSITMPSLLEEFQIDKVDLLKIDIEGAEVEIFENGTDWIFKVDHIACELHDSINNKCSQLFYESVVKRRFVQRIMGEKVFISFL